MPQFHKVYIEISNICNLQCTFCPEVERPKKIMSAASFGELLPEVLPLTEQITLHVMGEPLAHPEFERIVRICEEQGAKVNLTTNAILINRYRELLLSPAFVQINFSVHSFRDNFPGKDVRPYLKDIVDFSQYAAEKRPDLYINYRLWNLPDVQKAKEENAPILDFLEESYALTINRQVNVGLNKGKKLVGRTYVHFDTRFVWPSPHHPPVSCTGTCYGGVNQMAIHADGTVVPCCLDKEANVTLGKWPEQSLKDIADGERALALRGGFSKGLVVEDLCQRCTFRSRFDKKARSLNHSIVAAVQGQLRPGHLGKGVPRQ